MKHAIINAITPIVALLIGFVLSIIVMSKPTLNERVALQILSIASNVIAGALGMANQKNIDSASIRGDRISIQSVQGEGEEVRGSKDQEK